MVHILKFRTDLLSRSILEVLRKSDRTSIVWNAVRLFGRSAQNLLGTVLVLHFCKYRVLLPKKNCCNDSTTTVVDASIPCLCQMPLWFVKGPNGEFILAGEKIEIGEKLLQHLKILQVFPRSPIAKKNNIKEGRLLKCFQCCPC